MEIDQAADWAPTACTLPTSERPRRVAELDALFATARWSRRPHPARLEVAIPREAEATGRDLVERESACCSFFTFVFEPAGADVVLHIGVPASDAAVLNALHERVAAAIGEAHR